MDPSQSSSGSLPPVHLPVVQTQNTADETQGGASSLPPKSPIVDMDERDLFGSASEDEVAKPAAATGSGAVAALPAASRTAVEEDLFNSDGEDGPPRDPAKVLSDEKNLFGDEGSEMDADEMELFGSEEEGDETGAAAPGLKEPQPASRAGSEATVEPSEMDEEDVFGDLSDDEVGDSEKKEQEEVVLRRRPMPSAKRPFTALRMPNILSVEEKPFNPLKFSEEVRNGFTQHMSSQTKPVVKLLNPENCVRWRFRKNEDSQILTSDDGRPQYQSNSRIVEWEDGSRTLFVGEEAFPLSAIPDNVLLFEENTQEVSVCHGFIQTRLVAKPRSLDTETHEAVKRAQFNKFEPNSRSLLINTDEQTFLAQQADMEREQQKLKEKRDKKMVRAGVEDTKMNAAFLESDDDDGGAGPSVKRPRN